MIELVLELCLCSKILELIKIKPFHFRLKMFVVLLCLMITTAKKTAQMDQMNCVMILVLLRTLQEDTQ